MELCPKCSSSLFISKSFTTIEGQTVDTAEVYTNIQQICRNPQCDNYQKIVDTVKIKQEITR